MGTRRKWKIHLPRIRLLLGPDAEESEIRDGKAADDQEEIPSKPSSDEGLDPQSPKLATEDDPQQPAETAKRLLELLLCDQQLCDDLAVQLSDHEVNLQMAEPSEPTKKLHVGTVQETLVRALANPRSADRGNADAARAPQKEDAPCMKQGKERKCKGMESNERKQVNERLNARPSEEPCAGKPHAGICEGGTRQRVSLP